ncbi:DUF6316 family protein [Porticoccus litoralis]|uniref:DUF6316 family protein n=1 Tax=Porticoccus litoralis TaxID=434086 RepID=A0AAW8B3E2_9GAMM|nr:DUF6316 family protein [Porticoccus litoralis]MDP1520937.1 DUF6316 family protein [Porticoccus litoralis]
MLARQGEDETTRFRSERIECMNGKWYFAIREKTQMIGPFNSKEGAEKAARAYAADILAGRTDTDAMSHQFLMRAFSLT